MKVIPRKLAAGLALWLSVGWTGAYAKQITLTVMGFPGPAELANEEKAFWEDAEKELGYKIKFLKQTDYQDYLAKLLAMNSAGIAPDIVTRADYSFVFAGLYQDLTPFIKRDNYSLDDFDPLAMEAYNNKGKMYGFANVENHIIMEYNVDMFTKAGIGLLPQKWGDPSWTMDRMLELSRKFTVDTNGDGRTDQWGIAGLQWPWIWPYYWDADWANKDATKLTINTPNMIKAMKFMAELGTKHKVIGGAFGSGKAAMVFTGNWGLPWDYKQIGKKFKWDLAPNPMAVKPTTVAFVDPTVIMKQSKNKEAAWNLIKWMNAPKNQLRYFMRLRGGIPTRQSLIDNYVSEAGKGLPPVNLRIAWDARKYARYPSLLSNTRNSSQIDRVVSESINKLTSGSISAEQWAQSLEKQLGTLIKR